MKFSFLLKLFVTSAVLWYIFRLINTAKLGPTLATANLTWLSLAIFFFAVSQAGSIERWRLLVGRQPAVLAILIKSFFISAFFNFLMPTTVGGDAYRVYGLAHATGRWLEAAASVLMDRLVGLIGLVLLAVLAWFAVPSAHSDIEISAGLLLVCAGLATVLFALSYRPVLLKIVQPLRKLAQFPIQERTLQLQEIILDYRKQPCAIILAFLLTLVIQVAATAMYAAVARSLQISVSFSYLLLILPIIFTASQLPISLNGWGVREGVTVILLGHIGVDPTQALSLSLVCSAVSVLAGVAGTALFLREDMSLATVIRSKNFISAKASP